MNVNICKITTTNIYIQLRCTTFHLSYVRDIFEILKINNNYLYIYIFNY